MRLILFFVTGLITFSARAEPIPPHLGEWGFSDYFSYYNTSSNYGMGITAGTN